LLTVKIKTAKSLTDIRALVDTGSDFNIISKRFVEDKVFDGEIVARQFEDTSTFILKKMQKETRMSIGLPSYSLETYMHKSSAYDMILGALFLKKIRCDRELRETEDYHSCHEIILAVVSENESGCLEKQIKTDYSAFCENTLILEEHLEYDFNIQLIESFKEKNYKNRTMSLTQQSVVKDYIGTMLANNFIVPF
jgi:Retroviral aspartyl protease